MHTPDPIRAIRIPFTIPIGPGKALERFTCAYLVLGERTAIVDCGVAGSWPIIHEVLSRAGRQPSDVSHAVITHSHPDHIGGLATVRAETGCTVAAPDCEAAWIEDVDAQHAARPVPGFHELVEGSVGVDMRLADGDLIDLGGITLKAMAAPGHCPGQMAFFVDQAKALISADAVPVPGQPPIYEDVSATMQTIKRFLALPVQALYSAWDEPRFGFEAVASLRQGLGVVSGMHELVCRTLEQTDTDDPVEIAALVFAELGLPPMPPAPPLLGTIAAHMRECKDSRS